MWYAQGWDMVCVCVCVCVCRKRCDTIRTSSVVSTELFCLWGALFVRGEEGCQAGGWDCVVLHDGSSLFAAVHASLHDRHSSCVQEMCDTATLHFNPFWRLRLTLVVSQVACTLTQHCMPSFLEGKKFKEEKRREKLQAEKTTPHINQRKETHFGTKNCKTPLPADKKGPVREVEPTEYLKKKRSHRDWSTCDD